jgi:hypothetical protein
MRGRQVAKEEAAVLPFKMGKWREAVVRREL